MADVREEIYIRLNKYHMDMKYYDSINPMPDQANVAQKELDDCVDEHITDILRVVKAHTKPGPVGYGKKGRPARAEGFLRTCDKSLTQALDSLPGIGNPLPKEEAPDG